MVSTDWNDFKPMQNVTAKGPGGADDYPNWTYTYNESYHNITAGFYEFFNVHVLDSSYTMQPLIES